MKHTTDNNDGLFGGKFATLFMLYVLLLGVAGCTLSRGDLATGSTMLEANGGDGGGDDPPEAQTK